MAELKRDMETLKRHGFNLVKLQEHWAVDEPLEGHYDFSRYEELILPFPLSLSEEVAGKLARYVERGGNLISEACPGRIDEHAYCNRGELAPTMRELCGVNHESLTLVREPEGGARWSPTERTWGEYLDATMLTGDGPLAGQRARANVYLETFSCRGSTPCLRYGEAAAGTVRQVGQGRAWLLGTFLGHSGTAYRHPETHAFIRALLAQCGVASDALGKLLRRRRVGQHQEAWILTNPTGERLTEEFPLEGWAAVEDLLGEELTVQEGRVTLSVEPLDVRVLILRR
jgi:beta-galactosidase